MLSLFVHASIDNPFFSDNEIISTTIKVSRIGTKSKNDICLFLSSCLQSITFFTESFPKAMCSYQHYFSSIHSLIYSTNNSVTSAVCL